MTLRPHESRVRYRRVELDDGTVRYVPIPSNPLQALGDAATVEVRETSIREVREAALVEGRRQAGAE